MDALVPAVFRLIVHRSFALLIGALLLAVTSLPAQELWAGLEPGPHEIGFGVIAVRDSTRPMPDGSARPIQISYWYPAAPVADITPRMTVRDYFLLTAAELTLAPLDSSVAADAEVRLKSFLASNGVGEAVVDDWFARELAAVRNATPADGRFPLVLIAQGNFHAAYNQAVLAEYLASHGYVVATSPSQSRIDGPPAEGDPIIRAAQAQAADLRVMMRTLGRDAHVDSTRTGIVAHSFGARSAFLLVLDGDVDALVSLDGGIANRAGKDWLDGLSFDAKLVRTPILHIYQEIDPIVVPDFALLESLAGSERTLIRVDSLYHPHFTSLGIATEIVPGFAIGPPSPHVAAKVAAISDATRDFLDKHLVTRTAHREPVAIAEWFTVRHLAAEHR